MKEKPILFNGAMVRAILDGRKTQTRRIVKPQPEKIPDSHWKSNRTPRELQYWWPSKSCVSMVEVRDMAFLCPFGDVGDRLWVRETWANALNDPPSGFKQERFRPLDELNEQVTRRETVQDAIGIDA